MRKWGIIFSLLVTVTFLVSFTIGDSEADNLRKIYSQPSSAWPKPFVDGGVDWKELGILPESPIEQQKDSLKHLIELGKVLFFDPRLSSSEKISCATCHQPELNWTDGKEKSIGHEGAMNKRNSPTIQNSWFYKKLFWDGRSNSLEDQAFAPINSESEMHSEMPELPAKLRKIKGYPLLFDSAFGDPSINPHRITEAIAVFERTIVSSKSRFDEFLTANKKALSNAEIRGLHLFRTKARCMNCHNGPLFSDNQFHANGFFYNTTMPFDEGLYKVTHKESDIGKFKTPSLRDITGTGPFMHDGSIKKLKSILVIYGEGGVVRRDPLVKRIGLNKGEIQDIIAFLSAISSPPMEFKKPFLPQ